MRAKVLLTFVILGPPMGALAIFALSAIAMLSLLPLMYVLGRADIGTPIQAMAAILLLGVPASYVYGGIQATITGIAALASLKANEGREIKAMPVIGTAIACSLAIVTKSSTKVEILPAALLIALHAIPAYGCLEMSRRIIAKKRAAPATE